MGSFKSAQRRNWGSKTVKPCQVLEARCAAKLLSLGIDHRHDGFSVDVRFRVHSRHALEVEVYSTVGAAQLWTATLSSAAALFPVKVQPARVPTVDPQFEMYRAAPFCTANTIHSLGRDSACGSRNTTAAQRFGVRTCSATLLTNAVSETARAGQLCDLTAPPLPMLARFPLKTLCVMVLVLALAPQPIRVTAPPLFDVLFRNRDDVMVKLEPVIA